MPHDPQALNRARTHAKNLVKDVVGFDYDAPAELFPSRGRKGRSYAAYRRFDTAAEALRFANEDAPAQSMVGAYLEVDEARFGMEEMRYLYESTAYPLKRSARSN
jgi:hypothetical protein